VSQKPTGARGIFDEEKLTWRGVGVPKSTPGGRTSKLHTGGQEYRKEEPHPTKLLEEKSAGKGRKDVREGIADRRNTVRKIHFALPKKELSPSDQTYQQESSPLPGRTGAGAKHSSWGHRGCTGGQKIAFSRTAKASRPKERGRGKKKFPQFTHRDI